MKYKKHIFTPTFRSFSANLGEKAFDTVEVDKSPTLATPSTSALAKNAKECPYRVHIRSSMVWMRDSGAFTRQGAPRLYQQLFELYAWLRVEYGIIKARIPALLAKRAEAYSFGGNVWTASRVAEVIYSTF